MNRDDVIRDLMTLPNIGRTMAGYLHDAGVQSKKDFMASNAESLWMKIKACNTKTNICRTHYKAILGAQNGVSLNQIADT